MSNIKLQHTIESLGFFEGVISTIVTSSVKKGKEKEEEKESFMST